MKSTRANSRTTISSRFGIPFDRTNRPATCGASLGRSDSTAIQKHSFSKRLSSNVSERGGELDQDNDLALSEDFELNNSLSYLEKEAALKKLNDELEKKSLEIFQRIEKYSNRDRNDAPVTATEAGDAPIMLDPEKRVTNHEEDTTRSDTESVVDVESLRSFDSHQATSGSGSSVLSMATISEQCIASSETKDVDIQARKRLQKATESVVKCLQSKLLSHEGRLADLHIQFRQKIQENTMLEGKIRALEDDRDKLLRTISSLQHSAEKCSKTAELAKSNLNLKAQAFTSLKKDIETVKREEKQKATTIQNLQSRLNRVLDENERLKNHNRSLQINMRDRQHEDRAIIDELQQKICQLEQQKNILNATVGKQTGLIKTLRGNKMQVTSPLPQNNATCSRSNENIS